MSLTNTTKPRERAARKAVNVSIDAELVKEAREAGVNLSGLLESALRDKLKAHRTAKWQKENRQTIESMNAYIDEHGLPLAKFRVW
jgi:antitoxin CcdA